MGVDLPGIEAIALSKRYGRVLALEGISLAVRQGEVFGFIGPNGAGKTTTIRILAGLLAPDSGHARLYGQDPRDPRVRQQLGYLPGQLALWEATGEEHVAYFSRLRWVGPDGGRALAARWDLDLRRPVRSLSKGNRQKLGLVLALLGNPRLLILDEPTDGLDPLLQQEFRRVVRERAAEGTTVFLSSHSLPEVAALCDRIGLLQTGRLLGVETLADLRAKAVRQVRVRFAVPPPPGAFSGIPGLETVQLKANHLEARLEGSPDPLVKALARYQVLELTVADPDLEEVILARYGAISPR